MNPIATITMQNGKKIDKLLPDIAYNEVASFIWQPNTAIMTIIP